MPKLLPILVIIILVALLPLVAKEATGLRKAKPAFIGNPVFVLNQ
ncbi:hypothetical protein [Flavisolibacter ginsenosidimutans]|nr:hypothetical protein [Flavisolibacter ginsenosidimutans]